MKKLLLPLLLPLLWACHSDTEAIRQAAQGYLQAMGDYRIADAAPFATEETAATTLHYIATNIMPHADTDSAFAAYIASNTPATIEITAVERTSDTTATVAFVKTTPIQRQQGQKQLLKRNGQWRVHELIQVPNVIQAASQPDSLLNRTRPAEGLQAVPLAPSNLSAQ